MKEKKQTKDWNIAATHWITAGFAMPFLVNLVAGFIIFPLLNLKSEILIYIISLGLAILAIYLGVIYSAKYLKKKYLIEDKNKIVKLATIYLFVTRFGYNLVVFLTAEQVNTLQVSFELASIIVLTILFYLLSKKYIKATSSSIEVNK